MHVCMDDNGLQFLMLFLNHWHIKYITIHKKIWIFFKEKQVFSTLRLPGQSLLVW